MKHDLEFFNKIVHELLDREAVEPVVSSLSPEELTTVVDISLPENPTNTQLFEDSVRKLVFATPRTATHRFFNQLFGGRNSKAVLGDLLSVILNNGMHTYKVNGVQILVEKEIINSIKKMIGYDKKSGGIFTPGGSMSNFMGLLMARDKYDTNILKKGISKKMIIYTSDQSHYSMIKNIRFAGIGEENLRKIPSNSKGMLDIDELEKTIISDLKSGYHPFFVKGTAGTTVLGAFDNLEEIGKICKKYNLWFHIDGAFGGSSIFSDTYKHLLKGIETADSFALNAHKMLGTPISCSMIIVKDKKYLYQSFNSEADYLYQENEDELNPGMISIQCARTNDSLKLWTLWKSIGRKGLGEMIDKEFALADVARDYIRNNSNYTLHSFDNSVNVCFNYKDYKAEDICRILHEKGLLMVGYGLLNNRSFIRLVTVRHENNAKDILDFFHIIENCMEEK